MSDCDVCHRPISEHYQKLNGEHPPAWYEARLQAADQLAKAADLFSAAVFAEHEDGIVEHGQVLDRAISAYRSGSPSPSAAEQQRAEDLAQARKEKAWRPIGERAHEALLWCIEGFEGTYGGDFWLSPLGRRLRNAGFGHPDYPAPSAPVRTAEPLNDAVSILDSLARNADAIRLAFRRAGMPTGSLPLPGDSSFDAKSARIRAAAGAVRVTHEP